MESRITISTREGADFNDRFEVNNETFEIVTDDLGGGKCRIVTRIYSKGEILATATSDYKHLTNLPNAQDKIRTLMERQHRSSREAFTKKRRGPEKSKARYAHEIGEKTARGDQLGALDTAKEAIRTFPSDPFFLSHCGYLTATVEKNWKEGITLCEEAVRNLKLSNSSDMVFFFPLFYGHLGKVYLAGNRKKAALKAFHEGLRFDSSDSGLLMEIRKLGVRKRPVIPFLARGNPINIYLGRLRYRRAGRQPRI